MTLESILREQNLLALHGNIPISDSEWMVDFERVMQIGFIGEYFKKKREAENKSKGIIPA